MGIQEQYEAYPYPERHPRDEKKRLIVGSPSHPLEIDHFVFGGKRDWSKPIRILVAGGGTGDALVQMAQVLTTAKRPYEITYIDLSKASRAIAEARLKMRGLKGVRFITGSLLDAPEYGPFDYIDCCGVLHHLPDPQVGFQALSDAVAPGGGIGVMVYAPYGRSGVYPLQDAFGALTEGLSPEDKLSRAKAMYDAVPEGHPFKRNPHLVDHNASDAGFYDLLLHSQDQPMHIDQLIASLNAADMQFAGVPQSALYDLTRFSDVPDAMSVPAQMALAEKLDGTLKTHIVYATTEGPARYDDTAIPHLKGMKASALAQKVTRDGRLEITLNGTKHLIRLPKTVAPVLGAIDGRRDLATLQRHSGMDPLAWSANWGVTQKHLIRFGLMLFSRLLV